MRIFIADHSSSLQGRRFSPAWKICSVFFLARPALFASRRISDQKGGTPCPLEKKRPCKLLLWSAIILFYFSTIGWIWQDPVAKKDKQARKLYSEDKIDEALSKWRDAQIESPEKKELHYNIGSALYKQKKYEDAFGEYENALDSKDAGFQAKTYYNMGNTHYRMGKLPEAIEDYKKCLDIDPDDEDAKYNIEFVRKKIKENLDKQESRQRERQEEKEQPRQGQTQDQQSQSGQEEGKKGESEEKQEAQGEKQESREEQKEGEEGEMSEEDAMRLLDALKDEEKDLQKELRTQPGEGRYRVDKDW